MNRHSIQFKINIVFAIAFIAVAMIFGTALRFEHKEEHHKMFHKLDEITRALPVEAWNTNPGQLHSLARAYGLVIVDASERASILSGLSEIEAKHHAPIDPSLLPPLRPFKYRGDLYLHYQAADMNILFKEEFRENELPLLPLTLVGVMLMLVALYLVVRKSLRPVKILREEIKAYGQGRPVTSCDTLGNDEISMLYREFISSVERVEAMSAARKLFLRNIMHELNTPVAKGKLIAALSGDTNRQILTNIFERLDLLIKELSRIEHFSSGNYAPDIKPYRIIDIVDHARDLLFHEGPVHTDLGNHLFECDFEMMSLAFKNLIDNSFKHGTHTRIAWSEGALLFKSDGAPLEHDLSHYTEPFITGTGYESQAKGLGLGLYIVKNLLERQEYRLEYRHELQTNIFIIIPPAKERPHESS